MLQDKDFLTVKDVAEMLETEAYVLRFYEKELNLEIRRNSKGHRMYTIEDVEMFRKVQDMREQGFQLKAIEGIMHDSNQEAKESYRQLSSVQLAPTIPLKKSSIMSIDITDADNEKVRQFSGMMKDVFRQALVEHSEESKLEIKAEIKEEVKNVVDEQINKFQELQAAKDEEYYRKLDETMREVQKMRKEMGESKQEGKKQKTSFWGKIFKDKNETMDI